MKPAIASNSLSAWPRWQPAWALISCYGVSIDRLEAAGGKINAVHTSTGVVKADAYVLALGSYSPKLLRGISLRCHLIYPIKGYSITVAHHRRERVTPESTIMDETFKVAITIALVTVSHNTWSAARQRSPVLT